jgi:hypothetical protein
MQTMLLEEVGNELALRERKGMFGAVSVNLHAQELSSGSQIMEFEVRRQLLND